MSKVYLLLRNNNQTGPHSLEEIIQLGLKPHDLIWIERRSAGWSYPSEIDALKPYAPVTTNNEIKENFQSSTTPLERVSAKDFKAKKIFVSMPRKATQTSVMPPFEPEKILETKAEALRKRAEAYMPQTSLSIEPTDAKYSRSLQEVEEEYTKWIYQHKAKKKNPNNKQLMAAAVVVLFIVAGGLGVHVLFSKETNTPAHQLTVQPTLNSDNNNSVPSAESATSLIDESEEQISPKDAEKKLDVKKDDVVIVNEIKENKPSVHSTEVDKEIFVETAKQDQVILKENSSDPVTELPVEDKKTLKEKIGGIFKKLTKKDDSTPGATERNGERNAKKRNDADVPAAAEIDLTDVVEVKMAGNADSWMMGVKGLQLTLHNRSNATLKKAAVEVSYYSEHKNLLEKKTIYFSNISAKRTQTITAPEHRLADHADFKLLSAIGVEEAYASNN